MAKTEKIAGNRSVIGAGRPFKIKSPKHLIKIIQEYFDITKEEELSITGLCLSVGLNKQTFYNYRQKKEYKPIIDRARQIVENSYEISLRKHGRTGDIFALKNFGWKDKSEIDHGMSDKLFDKYKEMSNDDLIKQSNDLAERIVRLTKRD